MSITQRHGLLPSYVRKSD